MKRTRITIALRAGLLAVAVVGPAHAHTQLLTLREIGEHADVIFTAVVHAKAERPYQDGKMMFTDVTFSEVSVLHLRDGVQAPNGETITLSFAGGGEIRVCSVPEYEIGDRYLIAAHLDGKQYRSAVIGGMQGSFRLVRDHASGAQHVRTHDGRTVVGVRNGLPLTTSRVPGTHGEPGRDAAGNAADNAAAPPDRVPAPKALHRTRAGSLPVARSFEPPARDVMPELSLEQFVGELLPAHSPDATE